jgi:UDP-GlcNAc3NAcA epimerase
MKKIITIVGARPQIIKAAAFSRAVKKCGDGKLQEVLVHSGQHYDEGMSQVFFTEMGIPSPAHNLAVGSGSHAVQTARIMEGLERVFLEEKPHAVLVYGDTNTTLAAAMVASKMFIPVVHVEAGLRSFNKRMPEEINRIATDHVSTLLFAPTQTAIDNLEREGFSTSENHAPTIDKPLVLRSGDVMYDNAIHFSNRPEGDAYLSGLGLEKERYAVATIHRDNNTDFPDRLNGILDALKQWSSEHAMPVVLPTHPRLLKFLSESQQSELHAAGLLLVPPASYVQMIALLASSRLVFTDSGGLQKEAYFVQRPCVILRPETEWVELTVGGHAVVADADKNRILQAAQQLINRSFAAWPQLYGDGHAAEQICQSIIQYI